MRKDVTNDPAVTGDILARADVLWLALVDADGPYSVPVNFAAGDGLLYIHSGRRGRKAAALDSGAPLAFSAAVDILPKTGDAACKYGYRFRSIMGTGVPRRAEGDDMRAALDAITLKYAGRLLPYEDTALAATVAYIVEITSLSARIKE
ncbi:MAG: pyridoxamine 5'-phosphate oxidase family protein [Pseudodesulfovibrio sp.]|uniref:Pyridoxamine 5'-phosphate oxidase-related FMN-binding protein n=1 Tax=Pseudodesulfovibrio aespoeensis (strain ATCC 700646 / DSM 10631 / Aspo-2) TaxID=643562 RepID=E6VVN2_PSEA9|nr:MULTISPECIES: pyridoxamine 5'-phosphate oxidase family protein [Pseudodesulfovibrio]MBU4192537.1 pyridoxamine 5'-phosphate oxidase family protein [Pseudomonadota bacterium]ADU63590.1 pyridoxamine 5'-phosphate oxidase-related FMN-binding protein [Pseudodesulfovibrio aespoeensis Aspo-2]MBU4243554.1 pyridoxamine 5'-phosphate oxidase family protein [Pseudomonadota bacterium]MBU4378501.1 pyridoxamine 5'-phosphate oxidase family protein [Pseudomonadota bacterium]MBU4475301.1 pyridoxamine 5'-phosp